MTSDKNSGVLYCYGSKKPKTYSIGYKSTCARKFAPFYTFGYKLGVPKMAHNEPKGTQANPKKIRIEVKGKVTKVGFLTKVRDLTDEFHITGNARNIDDKWVEIYARGTNENLEGFIIELKKINSFIRIDSIVRYSENQKEYLTEREPVIWNRFIIYRPQNPKAIWERVDEGIEYLRGLDKTLSCFKGQTEFQFNYLGDKYHIISLSLIIGFALMIFLLTLIYLKP